MEINGVPTPDYAPPLPEWARGNPDDLNDALFNWPALDIDRMEQSPETYVRYFNGELHLRIKDIGSSGFGVPWGHTRVYSNRLSNSYDFGNGSNWLIHEWPQLVRRTTDLREVTRLHPETQETPTGCTLVLLRGTRNALWFDEFKSRTGVVLWRSRFGAKHVLEKDDKQNRFRLVAPNGHVWRFYAFSPSCIEPAERLSGGKSHDRRLDGKLIEHINPGGVTIGATYEDGLLRKYERKHKDKEGKETIEQFAYEYYPRDHIQRGRLHHVTWRRDQADLRRAVYTYYGKDEPYGNLGDLKTASRWLKAGREWKQREHDVHYYRYEVHPNGAYCQGLLQCVVGPEAYHRMRVDGIDPLSAVPSQIQQYADIFLTYHRGDAFLSRRVKTIALCGGGRTHSFDYQHSAESGQSPLTIPHKLPGYNSLQVLTTESRPDGSRKEVHTNFVGQTRWLTLVHGTLRWTHAWEYDEHHAGLTLKVEPSGVADVNALKPDQGRSLKLCYETSQGNNATNCAYLSEVAHCQGGSAPEPFVRYHYSRRQYGIWFVDAETRIGAVSQLPGNQPHGTNASAAPESVQSYAHSFVNNTLAQLQQKQTTLPDVDTSYFPNAAAYLHGTKSSMTEWFDRYGNLVRLSDLYSTTRVLEFDIPKGAPKREITIYHENGHQRRLVTNFTSDSIGRITETLFPSHRAVVPGETTERTVRTAVWRLYKDISGEVWTTHGYAIDGANSQLIKKHVNPVHIERYDLVWRLTDSIVATRPDFGRPQIDEVLPQQNWTRWRKQSFSTQGTKATVRIYHAIPANGEGVVGKNYQETSISLSLADRQRIVEPSEGTAFRTTFEARGLPITLEAKDANASFLTLAQVLYDKGKPGGNGLATSVRRHDGKRERVSSFDYDYRDRQTMAVEPDGQMVAYEYANQGQVVGMVRSHSHQKLAQKAFAYDARGRQIATQLSGRISDDRHTPLPPLVTLTLYNDANQVVAFEPYGRDANDFGLLRPMIVSGYDSLGRQTRKETRIDSSQHATFSTVSIRYNDASRPILTTVRSRYPRSEINVAIPTGDLGNESGVNPVTGASGLTPAKVQYLATWYDPLGREIATADLGDQGASTAEARPASIADITQFPISKTAYDSSGEVANVTDVFGNVTRLAHDHAGRVACIGQNVPETQWHSLSRFDSGFQVPGFLADDVSLAKFTHNDSGLLTSSTLHNATTGPQVSSIRYGTDFRIPGNAPVLSHLPVISIDAQGRQLQFEYNPLGELIQAKDQNGTVHKYDYDIAGRLEADRIIAFEDDSLDRTVQRIEYRYDEFGRARWIVSFDAPKDGNRVNGIIRRYGEFNELIVEAQCHSDKDFFAVRTSDTERYHGDSARVPNKPLPARGHIGYFYKYPSQEGTSSRNVFRLQTVWTPGTDGSQGRWISYRPRSTHDDILGRTAAIDDQPSSSIALPSRPLIKEFFGVQNVYETSVVNYSLLLPIPGLPYIPPRSRYTQRVMRSHSLKGSNAFSALDRFGRQQRLQWRRRKDVSISNTRIGSHDLVLEDQELVDHSHGFDIAGRLLSRQDRLAVGPQDETYEYDRNHRLKLYRRGRLSQRESRIANPREQHIRSLDQAGNWNVVQRNNESSSSAMELRTHSKTNHIQRIIANGAAFEPQYDCVGNMCSIPGTSQPGQRYACKYDGWNRLVQVSDSSGNKVRFDYDGLGRRIVKRTTRQNALQEVRHYYYDQGHNVLSEHLEQNGKYEIDREYIWDPDTNELVSRLRYNVPSRITPERLYPLRDEIGNVVALIDTDCQVRERYRFDPQGNVTIQNPDFSVRNQSAFEWEHLFCGLEREPLTGLYHVGEEFYHPRLGRALSRGPIRVTPESSLHAHVQAFPFGDWQPQGHYPGPSERWLNDCSPAIKRTIGTAGFAVAAIVVTASFFHEGPVSVLRLAGAIAGGVQAGTEAALVSGNGDDIFMSSGIGAAFGAIAPISAFGSLAGSAVGAGLGRLFGWDLTTAFQLGGLIGGVAGGIPYGLMTVVPELGGGMLGAGIGFYASGGDWNTALMGASLGMMAGGIGGGAARQFLSRRTTGALRGLRPIGCQKHIDSITCSRIFPIVSDFVPANQIGRSSYRPARISFYSVPNKSGGTVWVSTRPISDWHFAPLVNVSRSRKPIYILSGTHGGPHGGIGGIQKELEFFYQDVQRFGNRPNVFVFDINTLSINQFDEIVNSDARVIAAWCNSEMSTSVLRALGFL